MDSNQAKLRQLMKVQDAQKTSGKDKARLLKAMKEKEKAIQIEKEQNGRERQQHIITYDDRDSLVNQNKPIKKVTLAASNTHDNSNSNSNFDMKSYQPSGSNNSITNGLGLLANYDDDDDDNNDNNNDNVEMKSNNNLPMDFFDNDITPPPPPSSSSTAATNKSNTSSEDSNSSSSELPAGFFDDQYKPNSVTYSKQTTTTVISATTSSASNTNTNNNDNDLLFLTKLEQEIDNDDVHPDDGVDKQDDDDEQDDNIEETLQLAYKTKLAALLMKVNNDGNDNSTKLDILDSAREASDYVDSMITNIDAKEKKRTISNDVNDDVAIALMKKRNEKKKKQKLSETSSTFMNYNNDNNWNSQSLFM